jgi:hypothetical protein
MGNVHLVTGYAGKEHITAADQGVFNALIMGDGQFVFDRGNKLSATIVSNNQVRVFDGDILMQGRHIRLNPGKYVNLAIENGTQGLLRRDLIVARYTKEAGSGVEDVNLVVIKGTAASSNPVDPSYTDGNIREGEATQNDMPLYRVTLNGINIQSLEPLFRVELIELAKKQDETDLLAEGTEVVDEDHFPFYDASADLQKKVLWSRIKTILGNVFAPKSLAEENKERLDSIQETGIVNPADFNEFAEDMEGRIRAAMPKAGGTFTGTVMAGSSDQAASTSCLRNSKLVSSDTTPTANGEINWTYG